MDRDTAVARMRVKDAETAMIQQQEQMRYVERARSTATKPEIPFEKMLNVIGGDLSDYSYSNDEEDRQYENCDEDATRLDQLTDGDKPGCILGKISKMVQHHLPNDQQKLWRLDKLNKPGWGDAIN